MLQQFLLTAAEKYVKRNLRRDWTFQCYFIGRDEATVVWGGSEGGKESGIKVTAFMRDGKVKVESEAL